MRYRYTSTYRYLSTLTSIKILNNITYRILVLIVYGTILLRIVSYGFLRKLDRSSKMHDGFRKEKNPIDTKCPISAGAATPVLIAGIATSSVGAATNIGMRTYFFYL